MRKNCETCKHEDYQYYAYPFKSPCDECVTAKGSNTPSKWEAAEHYTPDTNADRIRAMSDEELEDFLITKEWVCDTYDSCSECPLRGEKGCISILEWLKQPAEGE